MGSTWQRFDILRVEEYTGTKLSLKIPISIQDITERKRSEKSLLNLSRCLRTLSAGNEALVHFTTEQEVMDGVCQAIVGQGAYRMACVGYVEQEPEPVVRLVASAGAEISQDESSTIPLENDSDQPSGLIPGVIQSGQPQVVSKLDDQNCLVLHLTQLKRDAIQSAAAFPLFVGGRVIGALGVFSATRELVDEQQIQILTELAQDLSYGIETQRTVLAHSNSEQRLQDAMAQTIQAIAATVEKRDPYTAGHQQRVAGLSVAIAREMGLSDTQIEGIRLGAIIHDIGKIYIPAEILNRPGKLSEHEFGLIKTHAEVGYDIVKDISFPWPLAQIILQHHERLDGSGYPQGLLEKDIIIEARILAVADVVEAITSHRPYRPALGLDVALQEIYKGKGRLFDPAVVDACQRVAKEQVSAWQ